MLRGACVDIFGVNSSAVVLQRSSEGDFCYSYPLVQYHRIGGSAAIVMIGDGVQWASKLLEQPERKVRLGRRDVNLRIATAQPATYEIGIQEGGVFSYDIMQWCAFNETNYQKWLTAKSSMGKVKVMESILVGNIISLLKGLGTEAASKIEVCIAYVSKPTEVTMKGSSSFIFDISFDCNVRLPLGIGVGKNASLGYGVVSKVGTIKKPNPKKQNRRQQPTSHTDTNQE